MTIAFMALFIALLSEAINTRIEKGLFNSGAYARGVQRHPIGD